MVAAATANPTPSSMTLEHRRSPPKTPSSPLLSASFAGASFGLLNTSSQNFAAAKTSAQKGGNLVRSSSLGSTTAGGSLSSSDPWGRDGAASLLHGSSSSAASSGPLSRRKTSMPLLIKVPRLYDNAWPFERERATLLSLKAEHLVLQKENRSLLGEIGRLCRQAKGRLTLQQAEATARQVELKHLQQLADEARRLLELKESLEQESASGVVHKDDSPPPEVQLQQAHAALMQRLRWLRAHEHANGISSRRYSGSSSAWYDDDEGMITIRTAPGDALGSLNSTCTSFSQFSASTGWAENGGRSHSNPMSAELAAAMRRPRPSTMPGSVEQ